MHRLFHLSQLLVTWCDWSGADLYCVLQLMTSPASMETALISFPAETSGEEPN